MRPSLLIASLFAVLAGAGSCAHTAEERHLEDMREQIDRLQTDRDRADERTLQPEVADESAPRVASPAALSGRPPPDVRALGQGDEGEDGADTDDKTPRPTIRVVGSRSSRGGARSEDQVVESSGDDGPAQGASTAAGARSSVLDPEAKRAYDAAIALVNARQYDKALDALAAFLVKWPDHPYAENAMFWRGECYVAKGDCARASEQLEGAITRYPAGRKTPDALLKLGLCSQKLGDPARAKAWFDRLSEQFPRSDAARRIPPPTAPPATPRGPAPEDPR
jgi:tol-pal system protein YbgF